jgi:aminoglycoside phosphotransferase (APT) family kinase protein
VIDTYREWIEDQSGDRVVAAERRLTGGSRALWIVELERTQVVLRIEAGGLAGTELSLAREVEVVRSLGDTPVPVPDVLAEKAGAVLLEFVAGESRPDRLVDPAVTAAFFETLGAVHSVDVEELAVLPIPSTVRGHAVDDLELWWRLAAAELDDIGPLYSRAFEWLEANAPTAVQRSVLVHGDAGPGNFIFSGSEVRALLDWEFAHVGDPMDDIAWCDLRSDRAPCFESWELRDRLYEAASGLTVDADVVSYYALFVRLRCALTTAVSVARGGGALGLVGYEQAQAGFDLSLARCLAFADGLDSVDVATAVDLPDLAEALDSLAEDPPSRRPEWTPEQRLAAVNEHRVRQHQARVDTFGGHLAALEQADRMDAPGYLHRQASRNAALWGITDVAAPTARNPG